jgi:hypothetical protein
MSIFSLCYYFARDNPCNNSNQATSGKMNHHTQFRGKLKSHPLFYGYGRDQEKIRPARQSERFQARACRHLPEPR